MRKKKFWVVLLTVLVFLSVAIMGVSTVFRVDRAEIRLTAVSDESSDEAEALRQKLLAAYKGDASFFVEGDKAKKIFEEFPYFRLTSLSVKYPDTLVVEVTEDAEIYAVEKADGEYYILGLDGIVLGERADHTNRSDGGNNVFLNGMTVTATRGKVLEGEGVAEILSFGKEMYSLLNGLRSNVTSIEWQKPAPSVTQICFQMKEGVKVFVQKPAELTKEKAKKLVDCYLSLTDSQRLTGEIRVTNAEDGQIMAAYFAN